MAHLVLNVPDIDASGKNFHFEIDSGWLQAELGDAGLRPADGGTVDVHAQRNGVEILVQGRVRTRVLAECVRCLGDAPLDVDTPITSLMRPRIHETEPEAEEIELTPEDVERDFYSGNEIVLDSLVRENIILEVPMKPLCSESCSGIAIPEGVRPPDVEDQRESVDPRLAPLAELARKMKKDQE